MIKARPQYYVLWGGVERGPLDGSEIQRLISREEVPKTARVRLVSSLDWQALEDFTDVDEVSGISRRPKLETIPDTPSAKFRQS